MENDDPRFQGSLREIIDSFRQAGVTAGKENSAAPTNENNSGNANNDGGEMGRARNIPTEQGTPGRYNTMVGGQEPKLSEPPQKEPASNLPPDVKAKEIAKDLAGGKFKETGNLSDQLAAEAKSSPAKAAEQTHTHEHERGGR